MATKEFCDGRLFNRSTGTRVGGFRCRNGERLGGEEYRVSSRWVYKLRRQRSETGEIAPRRGKTGPKPKLAAHVEQLVQLVEQQPDATLSELRQRLGVPVSLTTLWTTLKKLGVTLKKSPAGG